ncbi:hypothetical protein DH2020_042673 [Rehmannia glutinosa]|uniref:Protein kinase domain-containing protein n=1 Tax=Rehmannia glutinosa TaxID=99300 RepID=A0ABR0UMS1_REHGL
MKKQLLFAVKVFTLTSVYLFTRSRTPANKLRNPVKSIAVLFVLENLKRVLLYNARLIRDAKSQVEILENDIRLFKAFLEDCTKITNKDEALEELVGKIQDVVREGEDIIVVFTNQAAENRSGNFFQKAFCGPMKLISVAKEVKAIRANVKNIYDKSSVFSANRQIRAAAAEDATAEEKKEMFSVNCGSSGTSVARDGREWHGDVQPKFSSLLRINGSSTTSSVIHKLTSTDDPLPYKSARLSRDGFSYTFQVNPGQKIVCLHFNLAPFKGFKRCKDLFDVEAGPFTLFSNFSASLTAIALGVNSFVKEFCINIEENQQLNIIFSPASGQFLHTYDFINGIEIISVSTSISYFHGRDIGVQVVLVYIDNSIALEIIRRLNIKQDSVLSAGDIGDMFGMWETVPKRKASKINNITWKASVDVGFGYLVRLHFSKLGFNMAESGGIIFEVRINQMIANTNFDIVREKDDRDSISLYKDYIVMMKGNKQEGKRDLLIFLQSNNEFMDGHGPLKGFEVMKLSNPDNSLASPNPSPSTRDSSYCTIQNLQQALGHRNVTSTVAITLLALLNIIVYALRQIREASNTKEGNKPSARAERLCRLFSLAEIQLATRNFSDAHLIGRGGFGKVYKGLIDNGQGAHEFLTEIETLTELRHVNLVSLIGYCNEHGEMILVYEYMACGTLGDHLYKLSWNSDNSSSLTWTQQRLAICIGAGRGLVYLHIGHSVIHRDVKVSNILLNEIP